MSPFAKEAMKRTKPEITIITADQIISEPIQVLDLDLKYTDHSELDFIHSKTFISVKKTENFQGKFPMYSKLVFLREFINGSVPKSCHQKSYENSSRNPV